MTLDGDGKLGIGTETPDYTLDVAGTVGVDEYIYHNDDDDTFIRFQDDEINIKAGDVNFISIAETTQNKIVFNDGAADVDFIVRSPGESKALYLNAANEVFHINHGDAGFKTKIHSTNGEAVTVNEFGVIINEEGHAVNDFRVESDSNTHLLFVDAGTEKVGIGTGSPSTTLHAYANTASAYVATVDNDASSNAHGLKVTTDGNGSGTNVLDLESQSTTLFRVRGDGRVGIGKVTSLPSACLTVSGTTDGDADIAIASKLQHIGDSDTYLEFTTDVIELVAGAESMIKMSEGGGQVTVNNGSNDLEFRVLDNAGETIFTAHGTKSSVGIHNDSPDASYDLVVGEDVFIVSGSSVGIGSTWSGKELHVTDGDSSTSGAPTDSQVVVESGGNAGISLLAGGSRARIYFGDSSDIDEGIIEYKFTNNERYNITVAANEVMRIYESGYSNTITTLNGVKTTAGLFTEGHPYYSNDANITVGDCCVLENGQIVRSSSPMQKNVGGIAWYSVLDDLQNPGSSGDDAWPLTLNDDTVSRVAEDALGVQCNMVEQTTGEWVPTAKFQTLWKLAAVGDSRQSNYGTTDLAGFKVCDEGGAVAAGDLLCTSTAPGFLMKQPDDIMRGYTVGKAMEDVTFDGSGQAVGIYGYIYCG